MPSEQPARPPGGTPGAARIASLRVALVGYGEVGTILAAGLKHAGVGEVRAYDILVSQPAWKQQATKRAGADGVVLAESLAEAVGGADLVISAITAASTKAAATQVAGACAPGTLVVDVSSASPRVKQACAEIVDASGARYVEAAVMSAVPPHGIRAPMLLGGPHAEAAAPLLAALGFDAPAASRDYGVVSAIKLCRSVVVKGIEALAIESLLAARRYGVEKEVLASLAETYPGMQWDRQADYSWRRVFQHGKRRAEEMREAAVMVQDAGLEPHMAGATAEVQAWFAGLRASGAFDGLAKDAPWHELADRIAKDLP